MRQVLFVFLGVKTCVCVCVCQPPSVCVWLCEWWSVSNPSYWPSEACLRVSMCVCLCPFKTHADQPQLQPSMMHLPPQPVAMGGHLPCVFFFINLSLIFCYSTSSLFVFTNLLWVVCLWPSPPTPGCPIFLIAMFFAIATVLRDGSPRCVSWEIYMPEHTFRPRLINLRVVLFSF